MSTILEPLRRPPALPSGPPEPERRNYLNANYSLWSWLLSTDHKRIAILYMISITLFFFLGGAAAVLFRLELATPAGDLLISETYNKLFTAHGIIMIFFFLVPSIPAVLGNFLIPLMIGARDLAFPKLNLLSWYIYMIGGTFTIWALVHGWHRYRVDVLHALQQHLRQHQCDPDGGRDLYYRVLVDSHGSELHRHDPHDAGPGYDLVSPAVVHLGPLRDQPGHGPRHTRAGDHPAAGGPRTGPGNRHFRPRVGRRSAAVSASVLVLLAPRCLHHGASEHGRRERADHVLFTQANLRVPLHRLFQYRDRRARLSRLGASHVRQRAVGLCGARVFGPQHAGRDSLRRSKSSTGRRPFTKVPSRSRPRCCTLWDSLACSLWAD